jgi:hypothetical protein
MVVTKRAYPCHSGAGENLRKFSVRSGELEFRNFGFKIWEVGFVEENDFS